MRLADQPTGGGIEIDLAGGVTVNAHFVFDRAASNGIAFARLTLCIRHKFWHHKQ